MRVLGTAPGKLVLLGEYAVLHGHPALVMAVNRRARVEIASHNSDLFSVDAPDVQARHANFLFGGDGTLEWQSVDPDAIERLELFSQVIRALGTEVDYSRLAPFAITLSTTDFFTGQEGAQTKLGLGSSAALTVALASALLGTAGKERLLDEPETWLSKLLVMHRSFQSGLGSGLDIATALHGGVLEYRKAAGAAMPVASRLELPPELELLCIWSGRSASTPAYLRHLDAWRRTHLQDFESHMSVMGRIVTAGIDAVHMGDVPGFCAAVGAYGDALQDLGGASSLDIVSKEHMQIRSLASSLGLAYKPCGAGGGDVGAAFGTDPARLRYLQARLTKMGFSSLPIRPDPDGLRIRLS